MPLWRLASPCPLLAKWLPSVNASNEDVIRQAKRIARAMGMNDAQYRKTLSALRTKISIIENNLREKRLHLRLLQAALQGHVQVS
mgnify:CR=1 FL=1